MYLQNQSSKFESHNKPKTSFQTFGQYSLMTHWEKRYSHGKNQYADEGIDNSRDDGANAQVEAKAASIVNDPRVLIGERRSRRAVRLCCSHLELKKSLLRTSFPLPQNKDQELCRLCQKIHYSQVCLRVDYPGLSSLRSSCGNDDGKHISQGHIKLSKSRINVNSITRIIKMF